MIFVWWWGYRMKVRQVSTGYADCPACRHREPCDLMLVEQRRTLWEIVPLGRATRVREYIRCRTCGVELDSSRFSFHPLPC